MKPLPHVASRSFVGDADSTSCSDLTALLQLRNAVAHRDQHVAVGGQRLQIAERAVAGHDLRRRIRLLHREVRAVDHPADAAARAGVDKRIHAVEEHVAQVQHVGLLELDVDVGIGVGVWDLAEHQLIAVRVDAARRREGLRRQRVGRRRAGTSRRAGRAIHSAASWCCRARRSAAPSLRNAPLLSA